MHFGVNTWVWASPLTTDELEQIASRVSKMGFDWIEVAGALRDSNYDGHS